MCSLSPRVRELASAQAKRSSRSAIGEASMSWISSPASRLTARRAGMQRGQYRLSGRMGRRARA